MVELIKWKTNELMNKYRLKGISEDDKNLLLFYTKKGYSVDNAISRNMNNVEYPFAFSKKVDLNQKISQNETLYFK